MRSPSHCTSKAGRFGDSVLLLNLNLSYPLDSLPNCSLHWRITPAGCEPSRRSSVRMNMNNNQQQHPGMQSMPTHERPFPRNEFEEQAYNTCAGCGHQGHTARTCTHVGNAMLSNTTIDPIFMTDAACRYRYGTPRPTHYPINPTRHDACT